MNKNRQNEKFSVLVPVYNVEKFVAQCIESVLNQTHANFELILVDGGSTDSSGRICDEYAERDGRITVIHRENEGLIATRRAAIKVARGDWCVFLDSDDYLELNTLETLRQKIDEVECDCIYYGWNRVDPIGNKIGCSNDIESAFCIEDKRELYSFVFLHRGFNSLCRKAVKRELLSDEDYSSYYKIQRSEDLLQSLEIFKAAKRVLFIPVHLYNYRNNPTSITHTVNADTYVVNFTVREMALRFLQDENVWSDEVYQKYWKHCASLFFSEVLTVAGFDTDRKTIAGFLNDISKTDYYLKFISSDKYKNTRKELSAKERWTYFLFDSKQYWLLTSLVKMRTWLGAAARRLGLRRRRAK